MERMEGVDAGYLYMETPTMHMHTLKVAILERAGGFDFDRFSERGRRAARTGCRRSAAACCRCRCGSTTRCGSPTARSTRRGTSSASRCPRPGGMARARAARRPDRQHPAGPVGAAVGAARRARGSRAGGSRSSPRCTTRSPTAHAANNLLGNVTGDRGHRRGPRTGRSSRRPSRGRAGRLRAARRDRAGLLDLPALIGRTVVDASTGVVKLRRARTSSPPRPLLDVPRTSFNAAARRRGATSPPRRCRWPTSRRSRTRTG